MLLSGITILLVDEDPASLDALGSGLRRDGAEVVAAGSATAGAWAVRRQPPDVVICELDLTDLEGRSLLAVLRSSPGCSDLPAIALTEHVGLIPRAQALDAGFEKYLAKPASLDTIENAVCCLVAERTLPSSGIVVPMAELGEAIARRDYRSLMAALNAATSHRRSSFFCVEDERLASVWSFDRERPKSDLFPWGIRIGETPCARVVETGGALIVEDAHADERMSLQQRRFPMRSFCGVPVPDRGGQVTGVLCHFDSQPRVADARALDLLERTARLFRLLAAAI
jgi:CheY-like chemotaxis protein